MLQCLSNDSTVSLNAKKKKKIMMIVQNQRAQFSYSTTKNTAFNQFW